MNIEMPSSVEFGNGERKINVTFMPLKRSMKMKINYYLMHHLFKSIDFKELVSAFQTITVSTQGSDGKINIDFSFISSSFGNFLEVLSDDKVVNELFFKLGKDATVVIPGKPAQTFNSTQVVEDFLDFCDDDFIVFKFIWAAIEKQGFFPLGIPQISKRLPAIKKVLVDVIEELGIMFTSNTTETTSITEEVEENPNDTVGILEKLSKSQTG